MGLDSAVDFIGRNRARFLNGGSSDLLFADGWGGYQRWWAKALFASAILWVSSRFLMAPPRF